MVVTEEAIIEVEADPQVEDFIANCVANQATLLIAATIGLKEPSSEVLICLVEKEKEHHSLILRFS